MIENSPNFSKDLHAQIPQVSDVDYLLKWTKEFAALIFLPQYLVVMAYILSLSSALLDIHCSGRVRMQFITAAFVSFDMKLCNLGHIFVTHSWHFFCAGVQSYQPNVVYIGRGRNVYNKYQTVIRFKLIESIRNVYQTVKNYN